MRAARRKKRSRNGSAALVTSSNLVLLSKPMPGAGPAVAIAAAQFSLLQSPLAIVIAVSLVVGLLMVVLFGYTSDQKAIGVAKDQLKAHLLGVGLYRDL